MLKPWVELIKYCKEKFEKIKEGNPFVTITICNYSLKSSYMVFLRCISTSVSYVSSLLHHTLELLFGNYLFRLFDVYSVPNPKNVGIATFQTCNKNNPIQLFFIVIDKSSKPINIGIPFPRMVTVH